MAGSLSDDDLESVPTPRPVATATAEDSDDDTFQATGTTASQDEGDSDADTPAANAWDHASAVAPTWPGPFGFPTHSSSQGKEDLEDGSNHANTGHPQFLSTHAVHDGCNPAHPAAQPSEVTAGHDSCQHLPPHSNWPRIALAATMESQVVRRAAVETLAWCIAGRDDGLPANLSLAELASLREAMGDASRPWGTPPGSGALFFRGVRLGRYRDVKERVIEGFPGGVTSGCLLLSLPAWSFTKARASCCKSLVSSRPRQPKNGI
ncbi:unnamed protein product [Symbiodinium necroappetens]|uniref:Uncharacterized protein n=1 Tax=Symbiodinium necroappetens TaxID=1628268 RepID=A0A812RU36_9DINO|nr:unnamed protein product [Symbiodinium necroappetens]